VAGVAVSDDVRVLNPVPEYDRTPPQDIAAEQSVLGGMLLSKDAIADVIEILRTNDFYKPAHATVFDAILDLYGRGEPADAVTVSAALADGGGLVRVGGASYLHTLISMVPTAANAGYYAKIVAERAMLRRLVEAGTRIVQLGYGAASGQGRDVDDVVDLAQQAVYEVTERRTSEDYTILEELLQPTMDEIEAIGATGGVMSGVPTGFADLDRLTNGLHPGQLIVVAARPGLGKCVAHDTVLTDSLSGERMTVAEFVRRGQAGEKLAIHTLGDDWRLGKVRPSDFVHNGVRPVFRMTTRSGRRIRATANHPMRTLNGWVPLESLSPGDAIAVPRSLPVSGTDELPDALVALTAYLIGDGSLAVGTMGSADKHVPAEYFRLSTRQLRIFLSRLYATDGWASASEMKAGRTLVQIGYCTISERLARDVQHLLLRFGLTADLQRKKLKDQGEHRWAWQVLLREAGQIERFCEEIGIIGKSAELDRVYQAARSPKTHSNTDLLPREVWNLVLAEKGDTSWAEISERCGRPGNHQWHVGKHGIGRDRLAELAKALDSQRLRDLAESDVLWDPIVSIEPDGDAEVYDLTVDRTHNFVANDIVVHNSTFGLDVLRSASIRHGLTSAVFSLEMSKIEITMRLLSAEARVPLHHLRSGQLSEDDWTKLARRMGEVSEAPLFIDDSPNMTMMEIRAKARRLKQRHDLRIIVLDYLQLMSSPKRTESRQQEVSELSRGLKLLAKELEVPVIAVSQLNRGPEQRTDKRPQLSDLRESGAIEQDADMVLLLHREDYYEKESPRAGEADFIVAKHRNGPTDTITVAFQGHFSRFVDMSTGM
jgi:replicative DNA helicase